MKYSRGTAFLNLLPDSRLRWARHASAFIKALHDPGRAMGERNLRIHQPRGSGIRDRSRLPETMSPEAVRAAHMMTQPRQTRCFKQALVRVQHLFTETRGVQLTTADVALMAGLDSEVCRVLLR